MARKLSAKMAIALGEMRDHGGILRRWQGGFWTYPGCAVKGTSWPSGNSIPEWWVTAHTVSALVKRGEIEVSVSHPHFGFATEVRLAARKTEGE